MVHITNGCDRPVRCQMSTNVNPQVQEITVQPRTSADVSTYMGSPAREFTPNVHCTLQ